MRAEVPPSALGAAIRAKRLERGLSQAELAARSGKHPTYLNGIERGHRNPTWTVLSAIAAALDVPLSRLVDDAERLAEDASL
jgi:transcriptional regulator with XRE-family HTH domain